MIEERLEAVDLMTEDNVLCALVKVNVVDLLNLKLLKKGKKDDIIRGIFERNIEKERKAVAARKRNRG